MPLITNLYKGFSTKKFAAERTFHISDIKCVEEDLLNHIFTRRGERVMMPDYGTIIPDLAFEPMDEITLSILRDELETVVRFDPRVQLIFLKLNPDYDNSSVVAQLSLFYVELNVTGLINFNISFEQA